MRWRGVLAQTFGPWCPVGVWIWLNRLANGTAPEIGSYSPINLQWFTELDLLTRARDRDLDLVYRPWRDGFAMRLWALRRGDRGNYNKARLGGWRIDVRDPTADVRLLEFCFAVPLDQFLSDGKPRALARRALSDRLPKLVLDEPRKGLQAADLHEQLTAARDLISAELDRLDACPLASKALDLARLHRLVENWPVGGWERDEVRDPYLLVLLRGISIGHFLRRVSGGNR
jgi:asparagine synthase (glutamine-hydrolysing)